MEFKLHYWALFTPAWFLVTFVTSYLIAVFNEHVDAMFPFISDTGTVPPESCVFGLMLNLGALFMFITLYIRYRFVGIIQNNVVHFNQKRWNFWSAFFGTLACLGMSIVANFQETQVMSMHVVGAFMAFGLGAVYFLIQIRIAWTAKTPELGNLLASLLFTMASWPDSPLLGIVMNTLNYYSFIPVLCRNSSYNPVVGVNWWLRSYISWRSQSAMLMKWTRIVLSLLTVPFYVSTMVCTSMAFSEFDGEERIKWTPENKGYQLRLGATFSEWLMAIVMNLYVITFISDFKQIRFDEIYFTQSKYS